MIITAGSVNVSVPIYFVDDVSGTNTGEPTAGLLFSDIQTGGAGSYIRQGAARTAITLITLASASAAHADGGFILVDDTNTPGLYRLDVPDAAFATGVDQVVIYLKAVAGKNTVMRPLLIDVRADVLTRQMVESYAADGAAPTLSQALLMCQQLLGEFAISGTTLTLKKLDGLTTAATFTLSDATNPTSLTRAT